MPHIYLKLNDDWGNKFKFGYINGNEKKNLVKRLHDSKEEHPELSRFGSLYLFEKTDKYKLHYEEIDKIISLLIRNINKIEIVEEIYQVELPLLKELSKYLVESETKQSCEFMYNKGEKLFHQVLNEEFPLLGLKLIKKYTEEEVEEINNMYIKEEKGKEKVKKDYQELLKILKETRNGNNIKRKDDIQLRKDENKWIIKQYQEDYIKESIEKLEKYCRILLKAPTGAGKTYMIWRIISVIKPKKIIMFTPRKNLNEQNTKEKYLNIPEIKYKTIHKNEFTNKEDFLKEYNSSEYVIVAVCYNSSDKLKEFIKDEKIDLIWFDEAHTIEKWSENFWMTSEKIKYRISSTATPYNNMIENKEIFGELIEKVKIYELIKMGSLVPLRTTGLGNNNNNNNNSNNNCDLPKLICETYKKYDKHKGIVFCNKINNAVILYKKFSKEIYKEYNIKIFIYTGDNNENEYLKHCTDADINEFENYKGKALIISVKMIEMGYDFPPIDLIIFADMRSSFISIAQAIGRGMRTCDEYENKILDVLIPIYKNNTTDIKNILKYLHFVTNECEEPVIRKNDFEFNNGTINNLIKNYDGNDILPEIWHKYCSKYLNDFENIIKLLKKNNIRNENQYNQFRNIEGYGFLPLNMKDKFPNKFCWMELEPKKYLYPSTKKECNKLIYKLQDELFEKNENKYYNNYEKGLTETEQYIELNKINKYEKKIPEMPIDKYYL